MTDPNNVTPHAVEVSFSGNTTFIAYASTVAEANRMVTDLFKSGDWKNFDLLFHAAGLEAKPLTPEEVIALHKSGRKVNDLRTGEDSRGE